MDEILPKISPDDLYTPLGTSPAPDWRSCPSITFALSIVMILAAGVAFAGVESFDAVTPGRLPDDWICGVTGKGSPVWKVETDLSAPSKPNVLKQSGTGTFPWCVKKSTQITDGFVEVKFKPLAGREDRAGGLLWRFKDGDTITSPAQTRSKTMCRCITLSKGGASRSSTSLLRWPPISGIFCGWSFPAVHAAARIMAQSGSNEVLVSRVVTDLVAGAGLKFSERGSFELKGFRGDGICLPRACNAFPLSACDVCSPTPSLGRCVA